MITVDVITKQFEVEVEAKNIVTTCNDAIAVIKDEDGNTLKTENIPSGFTEDITINNGTINRSDATLITTILAEGTATIADSPVTVEYANGTPISTTNVKAASSATIQVPNPETLNSLVDSSTDAQVITAIELANKQNDVTDGLLAQYGGFPIMMNPLGTSMDNPCDCIIIGTSLYVLNSKTSSSFVQIYDLNTGALLRTKSTLGVRASAISKSQDELYYLVLVSAAGTTLIIRVSDDVTVATLPIGSFYGGDFIDNGNIWTTNNTNIINETTQAGVSVPPSITTPLVRSYVVKRKPSTSEMWIGGYDVIGGLFNGRIYVYTQAKIAVRNFAISGSSYNVKSVAGINFAGARNFIVATLAISAGSNTEERCMAIMEIDDNGNVIKEMPVNIISQSTNTLSINGLSIYEGYDRLTIAIGLNCSDRYALIVWE
jgi:hypothetical protein